MGKLILQTERLLLREMEERTQTMEEQVAAAVEQAPEPELNLSLFLKKTGTEE